MSTPASLRVQAGVTMPACLHVQAGVTMPASLHVQAGVTMPASLHVQAGYLPGLADADVAWQTLAFSAHGTRLELAVPVLTPAQLTAMSARVRDAGRDQLQALTVAQIIGAIDAAVARLLDRQDPARQQLDQLLPVITGLDPERLQRGLTAFLKTFRAPQLHRFVAADFANPMLLDAFQPSPRGGASRAFGPALLAHVWAGNTPALPLWSLVSGLLVKAGSIGKLPSAEPLFAGVFARVLAAVQPALADVLAVLWWPSGDAAAAAPLWQQADTVLAYGGNAALDTIARQLPVTTRFLPHGHKLGFALVTRAALDATQGPALARLAAFDVACHDQQACFSPQLIYVERGGRTSPASFAQHLAAELASLALRQPRRVLALDEAAAVAAWRQRCELQALAGQPLTLLGGDHAPWGVAYADAVQPLAPSAGHRTLLVAAVDSLDQALDQLAGHAAYLQTAGVAAAPAELYRLAQALGQAGVTRIAAIGAMTSPEAGWHHDGGCSLLDLVRMVDIDSAAEAAAEGFAAYRD